MHGVLPFMGLPRVRLDLATEQQHHHLTPHGIKVLLTPHSWVPFTEKQTKQFGADPRADKDRADLECLSSSSKDFVFNLTWSREQSVQQTKV